MALSASTKVTLRGVHVATRTKYEIAASTTIYPGGAIGLNSGYARPFATGDTFVGIATQNNNDLDNSSGSAGDLSVETITNCSALLTVTGVDNVTDHGAVCYASADDTFTLTGTPGTDEIGVVEKVVSTSDNTAWIKLHNITQAVTTTS